MLSCCTHPKRKEETIRDTTEAGRKIVFERTTCDGGCGRWIGDSTPRDDVEG